MPPYSRRAASIEPFLAMDVMERAFELERAGRSVVHLGIGEPNFPPPPAAVAALNQALARDETHYTDSRGIHELREAIAAEHSQRGGRPIDPERVLVSSGTSPAMLLVFSLLLDPGDEIVLPTPHYACYPNLIRAVGGVPVLVETYARDGWCIDADAVRAAVTSRTRGILVSSPANPTGAVQSRETLEALAGLGVPLISDEIYAGLVYGDEQTTAALSLTDDVFVLDGFSKRYAMTGFRLGYVIAPPDALRPLQRLAQNLFISASSFVQRAGIAALREGADTVRQMRDTLALRRKRLLEGLRGLGFVVPVDPAGAFYVFADARRFGTDSLALAFELLERTGVAVAPGIDFGQAGEGYLRFSYTASEDDIELGLARLAEGLENMDG
jgi:aspartate/methionine/tyrosine aminotransferase